MVLSHTGTELVSSCVPDPRPRQPRLRQSEGNAWGKERIVVRLPCCVQEREEIYRHNECGLCSVAKQTHFQHIGMQGQLTEDRDRQRSSSKEACPGTLVQGYLGIRQPHLDPILYGL